MPSKNTFRKTLFGIIAGLFCQFAFGQTTLAGFSFKSNGAAVNAERHSGEIPKLGELRSFQQLEFGIFKDPREIQIRNSISRVNKSYVYGKTKRLFQVHVQQGLSRSFYQSNEKYQDLILGISVGPQLSLFQPYYLFIFNTNQTGGEGEVTKEVYNPEVHLDQNSILGKTGWTEGLSELDAALSFSSKFWMDISWINNKNNFRSLRGGLELTYFTSPPKLLITSPEKKLYGNIFVSFHLGKKRTNSPLVNRI